MNQLSVSSLDDRLTRLERERLALKVAAAIAAPLLCLGLIAGARSADNPKEVRAQRVVVLDQRGMERASLGVHDDDVQFAFTDKASVPRIVMGLGGGPEKGTEAPYLNFRDRAGLPKLLLGVDKGGEPYLSSRPSKDREKEEKGKPRGEGKRDGAGVGEP